MCRRLKKVWASVRLPQLLHTGRFDRVLLPAQPSIDPGPSFLRRQDPSILHWVSNLQHKDESITSVLIGKRFLPNGPFSAFFNDFEIFNGPFLIILHRLLWAIFQVNGTMAHGPLLSQSLRLPQHYTNVEATCHRKMTNLQYWYLLRGTQRGLLAHCPLLLHYCCYQGTGDHPSQRLIYKEREKLNAGFTRGPIRS